jgi:hypothetical protein
LVVIFAARLSLSLRAHTRERLRDLLRVRVPVNKEEWPSPDPFLMLLMGRVSLFQKKQQKNGKLWVAPRLTDSNNVPSCKGYGAERPQILAPVGRRPRHFL